MSEPDKFWILFIAIIAFMAVLLTGEGLYYSHQKNKLFTERGYTQKAIPGTAGFHWVKE